MHSKIQLDSKQSNLFRLIVEFYIKNGLPVGSKTLVNSYHLHISTATVRSQMAQLEELGLIEKSHASSGRVPSFFGLEFFALNFNEPPDQDLRKKLHEVFSRRSTSIEETISLAAQAISDLVGVTLVTSKANQNELLKLIQLIELDNKRAVIVIVTSTGLVHNKTLNFSEIDVSLKDLRIAIRIFNERLLNIPLKELSLRAKILKPILAQALQKHEQILQAFIIKIFDFHDISQNSIYGRDKIMLSRDINREDLISVLELIEHKSIWSSLEEQTEEDQTIKIEVRPNNTSFISKRLFANGDLKREISAVGSSKMNYARAKNALLLLEEYIQKTEK